MVEKILQIFGYAVLIGSYDGCNDNILWTSSPQQMEYFNFIIKYHHLNKRE